MNADLFLHFVVEWPNGSQLPVRLPSTVTGSDLLHLLSFSYGHDQSISLISDGSFIYPNSPLTTLKQGGIIKVVLASPNNDLDDFDIPDDSLEELCAELLRIADVQFRFVEGHRTGDRFYRQLLLEESEAEESARERPVTVLGEQPDCVSKEPLPTLIGSGSDDELDTVDTIGQTEDRDGSVFPPDNAQRNWCW
jgi:hypothetical protein